MSTVLSELQTDHANLTRLLDALDRQLDVFNQGGRPDYEFIADFLDYCLGFPDRYHHPREDLIVETMRRRAPESAEDLAPLEAEHERINELTRRFADAVALAMQDQELPRARFAELAQTFLSTYRRHLSWEEETVFPRAQSVLSEADWQAIDARIAAPEDPLFGGSGAERYRALRRSLLTSAPD